MPENPVEERTEERKVSGVEDFLGEDKREGENFAEFELKGVKMHVGVKGDLNDDVKETIEGLHNKEVFEEDIGSELSGLVDRIDWENQEKDGGLRIAFEDGMAAEIPEEIESKVGGLEGDFNAMEVKGVGRILSLEEDLPDEDIEKRVQAIMLDKEGMKSHNAILEGPKEEEYKRYEPIRDAIWEMVNFVRNRGKERIKEDIKDRGLHEEWGSSPEELLKAAKGTITDQDVSQNIELADEYGLHPKRVKDIKSMLAEEEVENIGDLLEEVSKFQEGDMRKIVSFLGEVNSSHLSNSLTPQEILESRIEALRKAREKGKSPREFYRDILRDKKGQ